MLKRIIITYKAAYVDLPRAVWLLSLVVFVNRSGSMVLFFMTLYLTSQLEYSIATAGRMISVYGLGSLLGAYLGGWLSDLLGTSRVQIFSLLFSGLGFVILGYMHTPIAIAILLFLLAATSEAFRPANATALANACPSEIRSRGFALNRLAINLGWTIGPAVGGILATVNYVYLFWVDGITCLIAALLLWFFFHSAKTHEALRQVETKINGISPMRDYIFLLLLVLLLFLGIVFTQVFNTWPIYLRGVYRLMENQIGILMALNALMIVLFEMPLIHTLERKDSIQVIATGSLFLFIGFGLLPFGLGLKYAALSVIIWTMGEMLVFPIVTGFIANRALDQNRGKYMGMFTFTFSLAFVIGPAVGTGIYDRYGPTNLWIGIGTASIPIWIGFQKLRSMLRKEGGA